MNPLSSILQHAVSHCMPQLHVIACISHPETMLLLTLMPLLIPSFHSPTWSYLFFMNQPWMPSMRPLIKALMISFSWIMHFQILRVTITSFTTLFYNDLFAYLSHLQYKNL